MMPHDSDDTPAQDYGTGEPLPLGVLPQPRSNELTAVLNRGICIQPREPLPKMLPVCINHKK
jgi:hypothetical protein